MAVEDIGIKSQDNAPAAVRIIGVVLLPCTLLVPHRDLPYNKQHNMI
jgi:hypothetical protein